nr:DUF4338 domain-containing protein [Candidatus Omnitrophota bacterium]
MEKIMVKQGRKITPADIQFIQQLLADNPSWGRTRLSKELCKLWQWYNPNGQMKDMACRSLLVKLEQAECIVLPPSQSKWSKVPHNHSIPLVPHVRQEVHCGLKTLMPIQIRTVTQPSSDNALFSCLLSRYHYLGYKRTVGENMKYLIRDCAGRLLACILFGSAAWKIAPRDTFIGWDRQRREKNLGYITNNMRFLILPWVQVPHLASHILSRISRRISKDWTVRYGHSIYLLETFVDRSRFRGVCYRAANWRLVGQTKGRTRNDCNNTIRVPLKDIYLYPLVKNFRKELCHDA